MPELVDVARHFDDTQAYDAYTGTAAFMAQFSTFDESSPDGSVSRKRLMSTAPGVAIPVRRAIAITNEVWLVGDSSADMFNNTPIRLAFWLKRSSGLVNRLTIPQVLSSAAGYSLHGVVTSLKSTLNSPNDSDYNSQYAVYFASDEAVNIGQFIRFGSRILRVRGTNYEQSGFVCATADELERGVETATVVTGRSYNPVTDVATETTAAVSVITADPGILFKQLGPTADKYVAGDLTMFLASQPITGTKIAYRSEFWTILESYSEAGGYVAHVRRL